MRTVEFVVAVLLLELTPGPNMAYLAALSLTRGRRAALAGVVGVALGLVTHAVLSALGMGALVADSPLVYEVLRWAGVAFFRPSQTCTQAELRDAFLGESFRTGNCGTVSAFD